MEGSNGTSGSCGAAAGFCVLFFGFMGFILYFVIKDAGDFLKLYLQQSAVIFVLFVILWIFTSIPIINFIFYVLIWILGFLSLVAAIEAWCGKEFRIPIIAELGEIVFK